VGLPGAAVTPALPLTVRRAARLPTVDAVKAPPVRRRRPRRGFPTAVRRPRPASPTRRVGSRGGAGCSGSGSARLPPRHESAVHSSPGIGGREWECSDFSQPRVGCGLISDDPARAACARHCQADMPGRGAVRCAGGREASTRGRAHLTRNAAGLRTGGPLRIGQWRPPGTQMAPAKDRLRFRRGAQGRS